MVRAVKGSVRAVYPPGSLLSLSVVYGSTDSSGSELQLTGLWISPHAAMDSPPTCVAQSLNEKDKAVFQDLQTDDINTLKEGELQILHPF